MIDKFMDSWLKEAGALVAIGFITRINQSRLWWVLYCILVVLVIVNHIIRQRQKKNKLAGAVLDPKTRIVGTSAFTYSSKDVSDKEWEDIAEAGRQGRDKSYLVELYHEQHVRYERQKLDRFSIKITFVNLGSEPCNEVVLKLYPLLLSPGAKRDGLHQRVEVDTTDEDNAVDEQFADVTLPETPHHMGGVRVLTFKFSKGIPHDKKGATLCLTVTPEYAYDGQWLHVTNDNGVRSDTRAVRKVVVAATFKRAEPKNLHPMIMRFRDGLMGHYGPDEIAKIGDSYSMTYYGLALQELDGFSYGICWD
jgi:hypothetical protein